MAHWAHDQDSMPLVVLDNDFIKWVLLNLFEKRKRKIVITYHRVKFH